MSSRIEGMAKSTQSMLCPCCGVAILRVARDCVCGARFIGEPLDETPLKVLRLGPAMRSVALFLVVIAAVLIVTKWLAFVALLVIWSAWRAIKLSRHNPEWYGGYKTSAATLAITIAASATIAGYGIAHIPQALENYRTRQIAATQAAMYHFRGLLEEYKIRTGSYPRSAQQFKEAAGESAPLDYWERTIKYQTAPEAIADRLIGLGNRIPFNSFELRSAGPDGIIGTDDDIVMRDGIFFTNSEIKNQPVVQQLR